MSQVWLGTITAVIVAVIGVLGLIINEHYKSHKLRTAVAGVFCAEIGALLKLTLAEDTTVNWENIAKGLESGTITTFPKLYTPDLVWGPVFEKHIEHIGLMKVPDAEDIILFYNYLIAIRMLMRNLTEGKFDTFPNAGIIMANQIHAGLRFWKECTIIGARLLPSLHKTARGPWWFPI